MTAILLLIAAGFLLWAIGTFTTWFAGDDQPMIAPYKPGRVTFKMVLQNQLRDVREITRPLWGYALRLWAWWAPRLTNRAFLATITADMALVASGQDVWAFIAAHPLVAGGIVLMNLLTPLSSPGAPATIPAPEPNGLRGPGDEFEARGAARA